MRRLSRQNYHCMVAGVELEKHFNFRMVWEYLDVMMRLSGEGGRIRAAPLQSSLDYRNAHSCLPTLLVSNSDATEYFNGYVSLENGCLKLGAWHHGQGGLQKLLHHRNKNHTDFEPQKLTKQFQFRFIKSCSKPFNNLLCKACLGKRG